VLGAETTGAFAGNPPPGGASVSVTNSSARLDRPVPEFAPSRKPEWLLDFSLGVAQSYDDNVFASGVEKRLLPASYTVPPGSVAGLENRSSWLTSV
jgi:hypothetical protein